MCVCVGGAWSSLKKEKKMQIFDVILTTFMVQGNPRRDQERPLLAIDHLSHKIRHQLVPGRAPPGSPSAQEAHAQTESPLAPSSSPPRALRAS